MKGGSKCDGPFECLSFDLVTNFDIDHFSTPSPEQTVEANNIFETWTMLHWTSWARLYSQLPTVTTSFTFRSSDDLFLGLWHRNVLYNKNTLEQVTNPAFLYSFVNSTFIVTLLSIFKSPINRRKAEWQYYLPSGSDSYPMDYKLYYPRWMISLELTPQYRVALCFILVYWANACLEYVCIIQCTVNNSAISQHWG